MTILVLPQAAHEWPAGAVHDTVAAIIRAGGYGRTLTQSLLGRLAQFIADRFTELFSLLRGMPELRLVVIAATVIVVVGIAARIVTVRRLRDRAVRAAHRGRARAGTPADPWSTAQSLAAEGRYTEAAHALYAAVVERLAAARSIRVHASKTSGDYARELRLAESPVASQFRAFSRRFDRVVFGLRACTANDFELLVRDAQAMLDIRRAA